MKCVEQHHDVDPIGWRPRLDVGDDEVDIANPDTHGERFRPLDGGGAVVHPDKLAIPMPGGKGAGNFAGTATQIDGTRSPCQ